ncbi:DNA primase-helicase [Synechococcus phage ACG-2014f]|uniref:DnaB-like replicative helicase n=3 Tax=Atlauavirus TaxID=2733092 RepID=A0A0E3FTE8_9CAUD|nr:DNA primase-helicase [Synechococcus phage ACG-2014f_Syn7803C8]YP_009778893.1 DNA primase-helicase [Synechococcus phage ACG-2014f_Syn7803US26]AIX27526.1 DNA primase-helicase [Synechococcus phage ACG-2014f]AIX21499.1 DNA primase-helicase [Synechococcus phage ACG-2014f_Syn7803C8]AIX27814.1 DNA primase-helicase [Synechococcus phage ACG-2014f]AIX29019.1 DNA primase-helicase [Synechococcus phage ACG-2014f_Syn7803US26]AIX29568.1 DNA primase-helicase [Synechococcus phage ACG-2014f]
MDRIENLILRSLSHSEGFSRKVIPFIKPDYFHDNAEKVLFEEIAQYIVKYNSNVTVQALSIEVEQRTDLSDSDVKTIRTILDDFDAVTGTDEWMIDSTEKWCKKQAIYNALMESVSIANGDSQTKAEDAIPSILSEALGVSFDSNVGHDYIENAEDRWEYYHQKEDKIPFDIDLLNAITKGGLPNKTLNIALAGTGVGKSLFMCHVAASSLMQGKNVLYITAEMAEEKIAERIDSNLLNVNIKDLSELPKQMFEKKIDAVSKKTQGSLVIKEYPTASAHSGHFKSLLNELKLKKNFTPDIIFIDYLNICASSRIRAGANANSYTLVKSIAEEIRGLAVEFNVPIVSATQTTRSGYGNSDVGITDTSESFGLPATADLMIALISTEELEGLGQIMVKQLKNRYNDPTIHKRFVVGIDRAKMRLYDCEQAAQDDILDSGDDSEEKTSLKDKLAKLSF